jgi:hypothetical protein
LSNLVQMMALNNNLPIHSLQGDKLDIEDWFKKLIYKRKS